MIRKLITWNRNWSLTPLYSVLALLVYRELSIWMTHNNDVGTTLAFTFPFLLIFAVQPQYNSRASMFETALPIHGRDLFLARASSITLWTVIVIGGILLDSFIHPANRAEILRYTVEGGAVFLVAMLLPLCLRMPERRVSLWLTIPVRTVVLAVGGAAIYWLPAPLILAIFLTASGALIAVGAMLAPPSYQVTSMAIASVPPQIAESTAAPRLPQTRGSGFWQFWKAGFTWQSVVFMPCAGLLGFSGGAVLFFAIYLVQGTTASRQKTRWLTALPVSYRQLIAITMVGNLLPLAAGMIVGEAISEWTHFRPKVSISSGPRRDDRTISTETNVPLEFWNYAHGGTAPAIRAPWGETEAPDTIGLLGFHFYNRYTTRTSASPQFIAWQFARATQAVHGFSIPQSSYSAEWKKGLPVTSDFMSAHIVGALVGLTWGLYLMFLTEVIRVRRKPGRAAKRIRTVLNWTLALPGVLPYLIALYTITRSNDPVTLSMIGAVALRSVTSPGPVGASFLALVPLGITYALYEWAFRRSEFTGMHNQPKIWASQQA